MRDPKRGDIVRVEESKGLYWKGKIIRVYPLEASVEDINPGSCHYKAVTRHRLSDLKSWDPEDDVNI